MYGFFDRVVQGQHRIPVGDLLGKRLHDMPQLGRAIGLLVQAAGDGVMGQLAFH